MLCALIAAGAAALFLASGSPAYAHDERDPIEPSGDGSVPIYRTAGPTELVCKTDAEDFQKRIAGFEAANRARNLELFAQCQSDGFRDLQAAVDAVTTAGVRILVLPGLYEEQPSFAPLSDACSHLDAPWAHNNRYQVLSWEQQNTCPHVQNMVAIFEKTDLQIEGIGDDPTDVVFDAEYRLLNAIRVDRSNGIYLRNLTAQHATFNAIYIMEADGFVIDRALGRWNDEYGFLTFADDHGLYDGCEAYGNGDSGIYPGAAHNINADEGYEVSRYAIEVRNCYAHGNTLAYSGTAGDSVWAHDNVFTDNQTGVATDSSFPHHPGLPQNHALFERNVIADNNQDYNRYVRDGTCAKPSAERGYEEGVVCPAVGVPPGTGIFNPGGNWNVWRDNLIYGNHYVGVLTTWVPGIIREAPGVAEQFDTSHHNRYIGNILGRDGTGTPSPNGLDYWWDGQGTDNCWQPDRPAGSDPVALPTCAAGWAVAGPGTSRLVAEPVKIIELYDCLQFDLDSASIPDSCAWFGATGFARIDVRVVTVEAVVLLLTLVIASARLIDGPRRWLQAIVVGLGVSSGITRSISEAYDGTLWPAFGLLLLAAVWLVLWRALRGGAHPRMAVLTLLLGAATVTDAIDQSLVMIPFIPASPTYMRGLLEVIWTAAVVVTAIRGALYRAPAAGEAGHPRG